MARHFWQRFKKRLARRSRSDGAVRLTKVGLYVLVFLGILGLAAANTGNNGIYLVLASMFGTVLAAHVIGSANVRGLDVTLRAHGEIFANQPGLLDASLRQRGRWLPRWQLLLEAETETPGNNIAARRPAVRRTPPLFLPLLVPRHDVDERLQVLFRHRGRRRVRWAHVTSLFPLGFFRKGRRYPVDLEVLVYPELFAPSGPPPERSARRGEEEARRPGWGHELLGLRAYRPGDDPRGIHWKQTARTGELIYQERETEENREILIVLDNAVGELDEVGVRRFERLVSEAATAAVDYLESGYEVALLTREGLLPAHSGPRQRLRILEALALVEARPAAAEPLQPAAFSPAADDAAFRGDIHLAFGEVA